MNIRSGRYDESVVALLIRVMDGLAAGQSASAVLQGLPLVPPLPPADLAMADRLARATQADLGWLANHWRAWDDAQKREYMAAVLARWKAKPATEVSEEWFERWVGLEEGLDVQAGGPVQKGGEDGGEGV